MQRKSNIELLRIISMIFIIAHHYACHGGSYYGIWNGDNFVTASLLMSLGKIGVDIFVLITGYFMVRSDFKIIRIIRVELAILFYSIIWFVIAVNVLKIESISYLSLKDALLPSLMNKSTLYWFAPCYMGLQLLSPFLNKLVASLDKKQISLLIGILVSFISIIPTLLRSHTWYDGNMFLFILLYLVGAYIAEYGSCILSINKFVICGITVALYLLMNYATVTIRNNTQLYDKYGIYADSIWSGNSVFAIAISVLMLCFFLKLNISGSKIINGISATTFGIYLIHDNVYFRQYFWKRVFHTERYYESDKLWLHAIICIICVFVICSIIEFIRIKVFNIFIKRLEKMEFIKRTDKLFKI